MQVRLAQLPDRPATQARKVPLVPQAQLPDRQAQRVLRDQLALRATRARLEQLVAAEQV